jgi:hypothetical protein
VVQRCGVEQSDPVADVHAVYSLALIAIARGRRRKKPERPIVEPRKDEYMK